MITDDFLKLTDKLTEGFMLVKLSGEIITCNKIAARKLRTARCTLGSHKLGDLILEDQSELTSRLMASARSSTFVVLPIHFIGIDQQPIDATVYGSLYESAAQPEDSLVLLRMVYDNSLSKRFLTLNAEIAQQKSALSKLRISEQNLKASVAELKKANLLAEAANHSKTIFLANMRHEIRTPMNAVIANIHLALEDQLTAAQRDSLQQAEQSAGKLMDLLNDVIDLASAEQNGLELESEPFSVEFLMGGLITRSSAKCVQKNLAIQHNYSAALAKYYVGDIRYVRIVLEKLLDNAIKFTQQGAVTISVNPVTDGLAFAIEDTGVGMDAELLNSLGKVFTQGDATLARRYEGLGIGLSLAFRFTQLMGGKINIRSTVGKGSCFEVVLPLPQAAQGIIVETPIDNDHEHQDVASESASADKLPSGNFSSLLEKIRQQLSKGIINDQDLASLSSQCQSRSMTLQHTHFKNALDDFEFSDAIQKLDNMDSDYYHG